jgi:hypothetical protein
MRTKEATTAKLNRMCEQTVEVQDAHITASSSHFFKCEIDSSSKSRIQQCWIGSREADNVAQSAGIRAKGRTESNEYTCSYVLGAVDGNDLCAVLQAPIEGIQKGQ